MRVLDVDDGGATVRLTGGDCELLAMALQQWDESVIKSNRVKDPALAEVAAHGLGAALELLAYVSLMFQHANGIPTLKRHRRESGASEAAEDSSGDSDDDGDDDDGDDAEGKEGYRV